MSKEKNEYKTVFCILTLLIMQFLTKLGFWRAKYIKNLKFYFQLSVLFLFNWVFFINFPRFGIIDPLLLLFVDVFSIISRSSPGSYCNDLLFLLICLMGDIDLEIWLWRKATETLFLLSVFLLPSGIVTSGWLESRCWLLARLISFWNIWLMFSFILALVSM